MDERLNQIAFAHFLNEMGCDTGVDTISLMKEEVEKMTGKRFMRLIQGDCLEEMNKLIDEGVKVDCILTDLPYGTTACKWDNVIPFDEMWDCIKKIKSDERTPVIFFASQPFTSKLVMSNLKWFRHEWIYHKSCGSNFGVVKWQPMKEHEEILVFGEKSPYYYPIKEKRKGSGEKRVKHSKIHYGGEVSDNYGTMKRRVECKSYDNLRNPSSVQFFNNRKSGDRGYHPTQKPIELLEYLIRTYSKENQTVLDFCMGSGSTGVACQNTNRDFIGIEIENEYYDIAKRRCGVYQSKLEGFNV